MEQTKLDVSRKTRANLFNWRGQFTPELVEYLLSVYAAPGDVIADPFAGSGTVLLESARRQLPCYGFEINPAAYAMSRFYSICPMSIEERCSIVDCFERQLLPHTQSHLTLPLFSDGETFRFRHQNLIEFTNAFFPTLQSEWDRVLALNLLFQCEYQKADTLADSLRIAWYALKRAALALPVTSHSVTSLLCDARIAYTKAGSKPNLILTSPPYINVFNYHQNHRAILEAIGWNMLRVAVSEFGSNRKNRGNRFKTVIQYCLDMEQALRSFWHLLQDNGRVILVVGRESNVRGIPFYNGQIIEHLLASIGGFTLEAKRERKFLNKFGATIYEDILVCRKEGDLWDSLSGYGVASQHLEKAVILTSPEARRGIQDAIDCCESVMPSPILSFEEAYCRVQHTA